MTQSRKIFVLNSGGADSTTALSMVIDQHGEEDVETVSVFYGQKHRKELECAERVAEHYGVKHHVLDLSAIFKVCQCPLMSDSERSVPHEDYSTQVARSEDGVVETYIPFRNGLMLSAVASYAMSLYPDAMVDIYLANHADDSAGNAYPDCSVEFSDAIAEAIYLGTAHHVSVHSPFSKWTKKDIIGEGLRLGTPYQLTWSCYEGGDKACGVCGTCRDRRRAFRLNGCEDPIEYEKEDSEDV